MNWDGNGYAEAEQVQDQPGPFTTTFVFPWAKAPLSMNQRLHKMAEARIIADLRHLMHAKARHIPELDRCEVRLVWFVNTRRRRDDENIVATLKPLCDGLVDAEVVPDDTRAYMVKHMPEIRYEKGCEPRFEFTITELRADA
ncbi:hypothetical protein ABIQ69_11330 [Agromyces sp. G08B096]|uniref:Uncharacterized protein n=1 Tax=Agromyces sp. G08B096 TaxID=3156399 RepID=A0AAU7W4E0_9MICO